MGLKLKKITLTILMYDYRKYNHIKFLNKLNRKLLSHENPIKHN